MNKSEWWTENKTEVMEGVTILQVHIAKQSVAAATSASAPLLLNDVVHQVGEIAHCQWAATDEGVKRWNHDCHTPEGQIEVEKRIGRAIVRLIQLANVHGVNVQTGIQLELDKLELAEKA